MSATSVVKALSPVSATQIAADKNWELGSVDKLVIEWLDCDPLLAVRALNIHITGLRQILAICLYLFDFIQTAPKHEKLYPHNIYLKKMEFLLCLKRQRIKTQRDLVIYQIY